MTDLNLVTSSSGTDLLTLQDAEGVNAGGQIVGQGFNSSGNYVAFLLTPTAIAPTQTLRDLRGPPTPDITDAALLLIIGLAGIAIAGRCRRSPR